MHQLFLLRHAKAETQSVGGSDHERRLTEGGRQAAAAIGQAMRRAGLAPDVVLVSSAARTQQTFEMLESTGVWDEWPNTDALPALYMAGATQMRDLLRELPETVRSAMIIGHNPGLQELAVTLAGTLPDRPDLQRLASGYPTASLAEFMVATPWRKLGPGSAALQRFLQPQDAL